MSGQGPFPLQTAFELAQLGMDLLAQRYRREHPAATDDDVRAAVEAWLRERPGAPDGDAAGRPMPVPSGP